MNDLLTRLRRLGKPFQWRFLWLMHAALAPTLTMYVSDDVTLVMSVTPGLGEGGLDLIGP